jgi:AraC-like DNA-binding protein
VSNETRWQETGIAASVGNGQKTLSLNDIENWPEMGQKANWSAATLARNCGVSIRTLQRFFTKEMGKSPQKWLRRCRLKLAEEKLQQSTIKIVASELGYKQPNHFSREFKRQYGCPPKSYVQHASWAYSI